MRGMSKLFVFLVAAALAAGSSQASVVTNGNFETGDFTGWTVGIDPDYAGGGRPYYVDPNGDGWVVSNTPQTAYSMSPLSGYSAFNGFDGGVVTVPGGNPIPEADLNFFLRQAFSFSGIVTTAPLSFQFDIRAGYGNQQRVFDVRVLDVTLKVATTVFSYTAPFSDGFNPQTINLDLTSSLNALGSGNYWIEFHENIPQYYTGPGGFVLDNIAFDIEATPEEVVPEPASIAIWSLLGLAGAAGVRLRNKRAKRLTCEGRPARVT